MDALGEKQVLNQLGQMVDAKDILEGARVVIYFFASLWEGEQILKLLHQVHEKSEEKSIPIMIVYISFDEDENDFKESFYKKQGNWYALPYKDPTIYELVYRYQVSHLPDCVAVNSEGDLVALCGAEQLKQKGVNVLVTWT